MSLLTADRTMTKRSDVSTKIDSEALRLARTAASYKNVSLAEYLSEAVLAAVAKDWPDIVQGGRPIQKTPPKSRDKGSK